MCKSAFTQEMIVALLHDAEQSGATGEVICGHRIASETVYGWRRM